ncbi:MAG: hypothetical protein QXT92_00075 [Nitrososphaerota archaeon]
MSRKKVVSIKDERFEKTMAEWLEEALEKFEEEYGEIDPDESFDSVELGVFYATTRNGKKYKIYYATQVFRDCFAKEYVVSELGD